MQSNTKKESVTDRIYNDIKTKILNFEYPPKYVLTEIGVAEELGVSRTPVRNAFRLLEKDKFLTITPNKGVYVNSISLHNIEEAYEVKKIIETYCVELAASTVNIELINELDKNVKNESLRIKQGNYREAFEIGYMMHNILVEASGNAKFVEVMNNIGPIIMRTQNLIKESEKVCKSTLEKHINIIETIKGGNVEEAKINISELIDNFKEEAVFKYITEIIS